MGVEPTSPAWKAGVIAVIRQPPVYSKIPFDIPKNNRICQGFLEAVFALAPIRVYKSGFIFLLPAP